MSIKRKTETYIQPLRNLPSIEIGVVVSRWNPAITSELYLGCLQTLLEHGISEENIKKIEVPGSFELPFGAKLLLNQKKYSAIICLGCVIRGETKHDDYINHTIAQSLSHLSLGLNIPIIYGVVTTNTDQQAVERSGGKKGHKGIESAEAALELISLEQELNMHKRKIGFHES